MNFEQLLYVEVLAHSTSITQAANTLHITKMGLSNSINQLEQELSLTLFNRSVKGTTLTENGRKILPQFHKILNEQNNLKALAQQLSNDQTHKKITIYYVSSIIEELIEQFSLSFKRENPDIQVEIEKSSADKVIQDIINDEIDIGIIAINNLEDHHHLNHLEIIPICQSTLKLIIGPNHCLYQASTITKRDLQKAIFSVYNDLFNEQAFSRLQTICGPLKIGLKTDNSDLMFKSIRELNMLGIGRVTPNIDGLFNGCRLYSLNSFIPDTFTLSIITKHSFNDFKAKFINELRTFISCNIN